jgi:hypothetical protein
MIRFFFRVKHWLLFLFMFIVPVLFQAIVMGDLFAQMTTKGNNPFVFKSDHAIYFGAIIFLYAVIQFGWYWSMAFGLQRFIPKELRLNLNKFSVAFYLPIFYFIYFIGYFLSTFPPNQDDIYWLIGMIPFNFIAMGCIFYCMYFIAKALKTAELQRKVSFPEYIGEFAMIWFHWIGVWIIQPKLNNMMNDENSLLRDQTEKDI